MSASLKSCPCTQAQLQSEALQQWAPRLKEQPQLHRKLWEFCYICQALSERGMLRPGRRGLGFAVGREPLGSLFASFGCEIVATDLDEAKAREKGWAQTQQHAAKLETINERGICQPETFRQRVSFRSVDMRRIPRDLRDFDFVWSCCSFEHLGSLRQGERFIHAMTRCLKPGGVAVHTTEFNVLSNTHTIDHADNNVYRRRDFERMARHLRRAGHQIELDFDLGDQPADWQISRWPYQQNPILKFQLDECLCTSYGLIIEIGRRRTLLDRLLGRRAAA
ncbi:MAG TPA: methyltransferase domain-containing protein [Gemmataceae bacterium]|jgi:SAM-dependent methyltransferase